MRPLSDGANFLVVQTRATNRKVVTISLKKIDTPLPGELHSATATAPGVRSGSGQSFVSLIGLCPSGVPTLDVSIPMSEIRQPTSPPKTYEEMI
jgi:hypothetical protein